MDTDVGVEGYHPSGPLWLLSVTPSWSPHSSAAASSTAALLRIKMPFPAHPAQLGRTGFIKTTDAFRGGCKAAGPANLGSPSHSRPLVSAASYPEVVPSPKGSKVPSCSNFILFSNWWAMGFPRRTLLTSLLLVSLQQRVNNERLSTLEDQEIARTHREVMLFSMLLSVCIVNLWLWIRQ